MTTTKPDSLSDGEGGHTGGMDPANLDGEPSEAWVEQFEAASGMCWDCGVELATGGHAAGCRYSPPRWVPAQQDAAYIAEVEAHRRLIAAAPDLLEALKGIIDDAGSAFIYSRLIHGNVDDEDALKALQNDMAARINKARAAIAKAEAAS